MKSENLNVVPAALWVASGIVAGHAQLALPAGTAGASAEMAGAAAAAFGGYCGDFSHCLSEASAALLGAAGAFTATEDANRAALASIAR